MNNVVFSRNRPIGASSSGVGSAKAGESETMDIGVPISKIFVAQRKKCYIGHCILALQNATQRSHVLSVVSLGMRTVPFMFFVLIVKCSTKESRVPKYHSVAVLFQEIESDKTILGKSDIQKRGCIIPTSAAIRKKKHNFFYNTFLQGVQQNPNF